MEQPLEQLEPTDTFKDCNDRSCPEMVVIPAGTHTLFGASEDGSDFLQATTNIPRFALGKTPVTQEQWKAIMGSNPSNFGNCRGTCPVESVTWDEVQDYLRRLSQKTGSTYRLPSEAEWEYACMAGQKTEYCGGNNLDNVAWHDGNSGDTTHPVALKQANGFGLYDMSGNVWEWLQDCWGSNCQWRVVRGGSWDTFSQHLPAARRSLQDKDLRNEATGFRIARTAPTAANGSMAKANGPVDSKTAEASVPVAIKDPASITLPTGITLANWEQFAVNQLKAGKQDTVLKDGAAFRDQYGPVAHLDDILGKALQDKLVMIQANNPNDAAAALPVLNQLAAAFPGSLAVAAASRTNGIIAFDEAKKKHLAGDFDGALAGYQTALKLIPSADPLRKAVVEAVQRAAAKQKLERTGTFKDCNDGSCPEMIVIPAGTHTLFGVPADGMDEIVGIVNLRNKYGKQKQIKQGSNMSLPEWLARELNGELDLALSPHVLQGTVNIPRFALGKTLVTQGQWKAIMGGNPSDLKKCGDTCPVENVTWDEVQDYLRRLSQKTGSTYRLPSEAEWEYACMAGQKTEYCGGNNLDSVAWYHGNSGKTTHPVALKQANGFGLYDMSGNVWEWLQDCWGTICSERVVRGGSVGDLPQLLRAAQRKLNPSAKRNDVTGFRIAWTEPAPANDSMAKANGPVDSKTAAASLPVAIKDPASITVSPTGITLANWEQFAINQLDADKQDTVLEEGAAFRERYGRVAHLDDILGKALQDKLATIQVNNAIDAAAALPALNQLAAAFPGSLAIVAVSRAKGIIAFDEANKKHAAGDFDGALAGYQTALKLIPSADPLRKAVVEDIQRAAAKHKLEQTGTFKDCNDGSCPDMVVIRAGSFEMGSPSGEAGRDTNEGPQHTVQIARFALGRTAITRGQFAAFVSATGYDAGSNCWPKPKVMAVRNWRDPGYPQEDSHPVTCVNWNDAKAYVTWLSRKTGQSYRLPSEAEWEYAARAWTSTARYWGESADHQCLYANGADQTAKAQVPDASRWTANCSDGYAYIAPVASFKPNGFGLYDMLGNVRQLTEDCWNENYSGAPVNGSAWTGGDCGRVGRGGSWNDTPQRLRAAARNGVAIEGRSYDIGFRIARNVP